MADFETGLFEYSDGYRGFYRQWPGRRGGVLYLHGIQSHGLWFEGSAGRLAEAGFTVLLADRRGSGRNDAARGDVSGGVSRWLADGLELAAHLARGTGRPKVHLVAVSWGGKLAALLAEAAPERFSSLTLVAPGFFPAVDLAWPAKCRVAASAVLQPQRLFAIPLNEPELFTANPDRLEFLRRDERRLLAVTARFLVQSRRLDGLVRRSDLRLAAPAKLFLAGRDRIIRNQPTLGLFRGWRAPRKALSYHPEAAHTLEFEPSPNPFFSDLAGWVEDVDG